MLECPISMAIGRPLQPLDGPCRFEKDDEDNRDDQPRWATAFQNDFAARAAWCVTPYRDANHAPVVSLAGPADVEAAPGATVTLDVSGSVDPDGNRLYYSWWQYREPGTYKGSVAVKDSDKGLASVVIPAGAKPGETIHLIAEVTDDGKPPRFPPAP
jgi:hypothetical protein